MNQNSYLVETGECLGYCSVIPATVGEQHSFGDKYVKYCYRVGDRLFFRLDRTKNPTIEKNFSYQAPSSGQPEKYQKLRDGFKELAYLIDELCPDSRDKSTANTFLETANFWANASIARN